MQLVQSDVRELEVPMEHCVRVGSWMGGFNMALTVGSLHKLLAG